MTFKVPSSPNHLLLYECMMCINEDDQKNGYVIIRGLQTKKQNSGQTKNIWTWDLRWRWGSSECQQRRRARYPTPSKQFVASLWLQWWSRFWEALGWGLLSTFKFYLNFKMESIVKKHGLVGQSFSWSSPLHSSKGGICICIHVLVHNKPKPKTCSRWAPTTCWPRLGHRTRL